MQIKDCFGLQPGCREVCLPDGTQRVVAVEHTTMILVNDQPAFRVVCTPALLPQLALGRLLTEGWMPRCMRWRKLQSAGMEPASVSA